MARIHALRNKASFLKNFWYEAFKCAAQGGYVTEIRRRLHEFEETCKRLREFEEIEISWQSSRCDCEFQGGEKTLKTFLWISSKNSASGLQSYIIQMTRVLVQCTPGRWNGPTLYSTREMTRPGMR